MKTTIDIADGLMAEAKAHAREQGVTLRALIEDGLRRVLGDRHEDHDEAFELMLHGEPDAPNGQEAIDAALREAREGNCSTTPVSRRSAWLTVLPSCGPPIATSVAFPSCAPATR